MTSIVSVTVEKQFRKGNLPKPQDANIAVDVTETATTAAVTSTSVLDDKPHSTKQLPVSGENKSSSQTNIKAAETLQDHHVSTNPTLPSSPRTRSLALVPLRSALLKNNKHQQQQQPLEAKQFPIVLGRTNLSQWWYQSCDCQQYYCRLHCRPVAQNIGSLSKVMVQIDTKGTAHIVGKNPHLVNILSQERSNSKNANSNGNENSTTNTNTNSNNAIEGNNFQEGDEDVNRQIVLHPHDIISIGRRDREPWMRFQVVENAVATSNTTLKTGNNENRNSNSNCVTKNKCSKPEIDVHVESEIKPEIPAPSSRSLPPTQNEQHTNADMQKLAPQAVASAPVAANNNTATAASQQRSHNRDLELPEWITTTTNKSNTGKRNTSSQSNYSNGFGSITNTKEQQQHQQHQDMVATLTKAAAAAGAAADADERNKLKRQHRYRNNNNNSYYDYYHNSNYEADSSAAQRKRRRHTSSSFAPYPLCTASCNNKPVIRSAEESFHNGSFRRGGRIHLIVQDYETSASLVQATQRGTRRDKSSTETSACCGGSNNNETTTDNDRFHQRKARTDRNFIG